MFLIAEDAIDLPKLDSKSPPFWGILSRDDIERTTEAIPMR
jgi:hypothetical protein